MHNLDDLISAYELLVQGIENKATTNKERSYGGIIRSAKGALVENIAKRIIQLAWFELGNDMDRLSLEKVPVKIPLKRKYLQTIKSPEVVDYIKNNIKDYFYKIKSDVQVHIDDNLLMCVECKAYTENAMIKRILVDFTLLKQLYPELKCVLFQLESQLTGDYSQPNKKIIYGSHSTHTLLSYFDIDLNILTLLEGERKVDEPIHKGEFYKKLKKGNLKKALEKFKELLSEP